MWRIIETSTVNYVSVFPKKFQNFLFHFSWKEGNQPKILVTNFPLLVWDFKQSTQKDEQVEMLLWINIMLYQGNQMQRMNNWMMFHIKAKKTKNCENRIQRKKAAKKLMLSDQARQP